LIIAIAILLITRRRDAPQTPARLVKLTSAPGLEDDPAISPDGKFLAYTSDERGNLDVFVRPLGGGEAIRITDDPADDAQPAWSPDGKRVAFVSARARGGRLSIVLAQALGNFVTAKGGDLFVVAATGGAATKLVDNAFYPAWSPDGKWIAFQSPRGGKWDLWKIPAAGGNPIALTHDYDFDYQPSWSPDGKTIVYASGTPEVYRLKLMDVTDGTTRTITDGQDGVLLNPVFTADGKSLVYSSQRGGGSLNLWRLAVTGNAKPERVTLGEGDHVHPTMSRDGKRIIYAAVRQTPDLWTFDVASGKAEQVTFDTGREEFPHRSRDGALVFSSDRGGKDALWVLDSRGVRQLAVKPYIHQPRWSPDGKRIAYRFLDGTITTILVQEASDGTVRAIARNAETPSWSPDGRHLTFTMWTNTKPKGQIHIGSLDGGAPQRLTSIDQVTSYPTFSPDGKFVSFQATRDDGARHVWIVEVATKRVRRLTSGDFADSHPQWSPVDAETILFVRNHENLMTVSAASGEVREMTHFSAPNAVLDYPSWSPDGTRVDFSIAPKRGDLYMLVSDPR
jgi:Tol biopolymer transport system component